MAKGNPVYQYVTEEIIRQLEQGVVPWRKPWNTKENPAINYITRKPYRGINTLLLSKAGEYMTFKQVQDLKGKVKKGSKSHMVIFYKIDKKLKEDSDGNKKIDTYFILRYYRVFHLDDIEGIPSKIEKPESENSPINEAENILALYKDKPEITNANQGRAYYSPSEDYINVPGIECFNSEEEYYSTLFHECIHSTGHKSRLNRFAEEDQANAAFSSESYSKEELTAEVGAAMLCGLAGIDVTIDNSAAYIGGWLKRLKDDNKLIVQAANKAQAAADYIQGIKPEHA